VIEQLLALSSSCQLILLLGDHEELFLSAVLNQQEIPRWLRHGGQDTLQSSGWQPNDPIRSIDSIAPPEHIAFIQTARDFHEVDTSIFVHAGYVSELAMHEQPGLALRWRVSNHDTCKPHC